MHALAFADHSGTHITPRAATLFGESEGLLHKHTDRLFVYLMIVQWLGGIIAAVLLSPRAWVGATSSVHIHVWAATLLGGAILGLPCYLALAHSGRMLTRHAIAVAEMLQTALFIHLTGGRIESHFQIFGLLAFLAFYRDWRVLLTATLVTAGDHLIRGLIWPESAYGVLTPGSLRWVEHASWVIFEDIFLLLAIRANRLALLGHSKRRAELEDANQSFERKVAERTQQLTEELAVRRRQEEALSRARDAALQAARLKAEFLANMSHEIRTPINGIIGMTGLLLDTELSKEQNEFAEIIRSCSDSLLTLINDILDFSKIEAGKLHFEELDFDARETVEGVVEMLAERAQSKELELITLVHDDVPTALRGDPGRLRQVLMNLIGNALKFTEKGEVVVQATLNSETEHDATLCFEVHDSGIGISEEGCKSLFQAFYQADGSTTRKYAGTGLGLAISKRLVEMMNGEIGVKSTPGVGSTFWFTVKLEKQQPAPIDSRATPVDLSRIRVLVIDDNNTNCQVVRMQLKSRGISSEEAHSAEEAFTRLRKELELEQPFDLVLLDMQMPVVDGLMLAQQIHADPTLAATKLIMMTSLGNGDRARDAQLRAAGVAICLTKPVKQSKLFDTMSVVMTGHTGRTAKAQRPETLPAESTDQYAAVTTANKSRAHILVAEDNPVNQKVILRQLAKLGYRADAVTNGLEVLAAIEQIKYDLILMDCQMPEMDGYTAAQELRRRQRAGAALHIIALTAHTMQGDREKCMAAGMDDYLGKPVKPEELERKLESWLLTQQNKATRKALEAAAESLIDIAALNASTDGDATFRREMLELYLSQGTELIAALRTAVDTRRILEVEKLAHSLVGSSMCFGMRTIVPPLRQLESMARKGELNDPGTPLSAVAQEFARIQSFLLKSSLMAAA